MAFLTSTQRSNRRFHSARAFCLFWLLAHAALIELKMTARGQALSYTQTPARYKVEAVFLYNFAQYVDWPQQAFNSDSAPFVIGVLGTDPFGKMLEDVTRNEKINGHPFEIRRFQRADEAVSCHILYISESEEKRMREILAAVRGRPVLTVGETEGFVAQGGMIRFVLGGSRLRFRINVDSAKESQLTISAKLLRLADVGGAQKDH
jgi:hypothetical protein